MHKHQRQTLFSPQRLFLLLALCLGTSNAAITTTPPPIIDTEPPTNITINAPTVSVATFYATRPVIILNMATEVASSVVATDATSAGSPSADIPGSPTGQIGPLAPGKHIITWTATDLGNNSFTTEQIINVLPEVNLAVDQTVGEGNTNVTVTAYLSGTAPTYPVTLKYTINATSTAIGGVDHDAPTNGTLVINSPDTAGSIRFTVFNDGVTDTNETIIFDLDTTDLQTNQADRIIAGSKTRHTVTISETNLAPIITITATQGASPSSTHTLATAGGRVTLTASAKDPNGDTIDGYDWSASDNALVPIGGTTTSIFTLNPIGLNPGIYTARVTARDSLNATSTQEILLRVYTTLPTLSTTADSDDDGIKDNIEGFNDNDDDGIPNYFDAVSNPAWLPGRDLLTYKADLKRSDTFVSGPITFSWQLDAAAITSNRVYYPLLLATEPGLKLGIGPTAFANGSNYGRIGTREAALHFGSPAPSDLISADGQVIDVEISGLGTTGQSVYLVIPQAAPLAGAASFKIMSSAHSWQDFANDGSSNTLFFVTNKSSDNYCPKPASGSYIAVMPGSSEISSGVSCIELLIKDGGPNDYDGKANGVIRLLGAPFIAADSNTSTITSPPEFNGGAEGTVESLNKISLAQGGGGVGFIGLWGILGLLLAYEMRHRR